MIKPREDLSEIDNKYKPLLCNMVNCRYKDYSIEKHGLVCNTFVGKSRKGVYCSKWATIDQFKLFFFVKKYGLKENTDQI